MKSGRRRKDESSSGSSSRSSSPSRSRSRGSGKGGKKLYVSGFDRKPNKRVLMEVIRSTGVRIQPVTTENNRHLIFTERSKTCTPCVMVLSLNLKLPEEQKRPSDRIAMFGSLSYVDTPGSINPSISLSEHPITQTDPSIWPAFFLALRRAARFSYWSLKYRRNE